MAAATTGGVLAQFPDVICEKIGRFNGWRVRLEDVRGALHSVHTKVPHVFTSEAAACEKEVQKLIDNGVLRRYFGKPKHIIPLFSVPKKDSTERRIVLDFRCLNKMTERSPALPVNRESLVQSLSGWKNYAKFDFRHGFYQMEIDKGLQDHFVIIFHKRTYCFQRLPQGWTNSPAFFDTAVQMTMAKIRDAFKEQKIQAVIENYIDDLCIGAQSQAQLEKATRVLLDHCRQFGWTISGRKLQWNQPKMEFLGYQFSAQGVLPERQMKQKVAQMKPPKSKKELRSCLGLIRTLLRFCRIKTDSLAKLQHMSQWTSTQIKKYWEDNGAYWGDILRQFQKCWHNQPHQAGKTVHLYVDACRQGYGFALIDATTRKVVQLGTGALDPDRFSSSGRVELHALQKAFQAVRHLLIGREFTVFTDAMVVKQADYPKNQSVLVQKYLDTLNLTAGSIVHTDGVKNTIADILSRSEYWQASFKVEKSQEHSIEMAGQIRAPGREQFPEWYQFMPEYLRSKKMPEDWNSIERARLRQRSSQFRLARDQMQYSADGMTWVQCCTSPGDIQRWLKEAHEQAGHYGIHETQRKLGQMVFIPSCRQYVEDWVKGCDRCQRYARKDPTSQQTFSTWQEFNQGVGIDVIGPLSEDGLRRYIYCSVDLCTRWVTLTAARHANAAATIDHLERRCQLLGYPQFLLSDNASNFTGNAVSQWLQARSIQRRVIPAYRPQCNGTTERTNQEVIRRLQRIKTDAHWAKLLPTVQSLLNSHPNTTTGVSAYAATFGYEPRFSTTDAVSPMSTEVDSNPHAAAQRTAVVQEIRWRAIDSSMQSQTNRFLQQHYKKQPLAVGNHVLYFDSTVSQVHGAKFLDRWTGPFVITTVLSSSLYKIKLVSSSRKPFLAHRDLLRRYHLRSLLQGSDCGGC